MVLYEFLCALKMVDSAVALRNEGHVDYVEVLCSNYKGTI